MHKFLSDAVKSVGFSGLKEYYGSEHWRLIESAVLGKQKCCQECEKADATKVFLKRWTKSSLLGKTHKGMKAVCQDCYLVLQKERGMGKKARADVSEEQKWAEAMKRMAERNKRAKAMTG